MDQTRKTRTVNDLRDWLVGSAAIGELSTVKGADWDQEIGCISALCSQQSHPPAVLFDDIKGYPSGYRVLTGALGTPGRVALALELPANYTAHELIDTLKAAIPKWYATMDQFAPEVVSSGAVAENVHEGQDINLFEFPVPKWHPRDGGRAIGTGDAVITRDPENGDVNLGSYRSMVGNEKEAMVYISPNKHGRFHYEAYHAKNQDCPVAISVGHDPLIFMTASINFPAGSEYKMAGAMRGRPVKVIIDERTGLPIPADAEIVIIGHLKPGLKKEEGAFGEWTGYYASHEKMAPAFGVERIYHRNNPVILGAPPHRGSSDSGLFSQAMGSALLESDAARQGLPGVKRIWLHPTVNTLLIIASIKQMYAGHDKDVGMFIHSRRVRAPLGRYVVIVDEDIDPTNMEEVIWAICTRCDPAQHIDVIHRARSNMNDPIIPLGSVKNHAYYTGRAIISAVKPYEWKDTFFNDIRLDPEVVARVKNKWGEQLRLKG